MLDGVTRTYRLLKCLYGLKQSGRNWYEHLKKFLVERLGLQECKAVPCLFVKRHADGSTSYVVVYVDDTSINTTNLKFRNELVKAIRKEFITSDERELSFFLGADVIFKEDKMHVLRYQKIGKLLTKYGMQGSAACATPATTERLSGLDAPTCHEEAIQHPYATLEGELGYLAVSWRPDLAWITGEAARFVANPGEKHWMALKRALRYLQGTRGLGLTHTRGTPKALTAWVDANWAHPEDDWKSIGGYVIFFGDMPVSWASRRQATVAQSTAEAEYTAMGVVTMQVLFLRRVLEELGVRQARPPVIYCDNEAAIKTARNPTFSNRTKHIATKYHLAKENEGTAVEFTYVRSEHNLADIFTKPLGAEKFSGFVKELVQPAPKEEIERLELATLLLDRRGVLECHSDRENHTDTHTRTSNSVNHTIPWNSENRRIQ